MRLLGYEPEVIVVNHDPDSIATHTLNHPEADHRCTGVDDIEPRSLFKRGELDVLWASPECTNHSKAKGGKPRDDQSRATGHCVIKWAEQVGPRIIMVENVAEFMDWGPIGSDGKPLKSGRGKTFQAWIGMLRSLGYRVEYRKIVCADQGDPTTRERLFIMAVKGRLGGKVLRCVWPNRTHAPVAEIARRETDLFAPHEAKLLPWVPARDIIDWKIEGKSIFERERALSPKTMARIWAGLRKFGLKGFIVPQFGERVGQEPRVHDLGEPAPAVTSHGAGALVQPFIITMEHGGSVRDIERPLPTITTARCGAMAVARPFLVTVANGGEDEFRCRSLGEPVPTVTAGACRFAIAEPYLVKLRGSTLAHLQSAASAIEEPCGTITASGTHFALAVPFLVNMKGRSDAADLDLPAPTITSHARHLCLGEPYLVQVAHGAAASDECRSRSLSSPLPTVCGNRGDIALIQPFIVKTANGVSRAGEETRARDLAVPLPTLTASTDFALIEPHLLPQNQGGSLRKVSEPVPTVATAGAIGLVEPFLISYYGTGTAYSTADPLDTVTTKDRHALVFPIVEIEGQRYRLDIKFRMLQPHELAAAQGFPRDYKFAGNKTKTTKQVGNAVPRHTARSLFLSVLTQEADVSWAFDEPQKEVAA